MKEAGWLAEAAATDLEVYLVQQHAQHQGHARLVAGRPQGNRQSSGGQAGRW